VRPPTQYLGSKGRLAPWIASLLPGHRTYVEAFAGSAAVLFAKPPSPTEVINDRDGDLVCLFRVLRDRGPELARALQLTPYARAELAAATPDSTPPQDHSIPQALRSGETRAFMCNWCGTHLEVDRAQVTTPRELGPCPACRFTGATKGWWPAHPRDFDLTPDGLDELERARRVSVRLNMTLGKTLRRASGFAAAFNTNGHDHDHAHKFASLADHLPAAAERLRRVIIEDRPAVEVISKYGAANAVIYCDPLYLEATRSALAKRRGADYAVEYASEPEHRELAAALHASPAAVLLSGYPSALYEDLYAGWWRVERPVDKPSSLTSGGRAARGVEVIWSNRPLRQQLRLPETTLTTADQEMR
jgi:DNA adenine methylase